MDSGTVFKFDVPFGLGCAYGKMVDFSGLSLYYGITIKVYDYFEDKENIEASFFKDMPLFMNPIPVVKMPSLRGKSAWKKIGVIKERSDMDIPVYKRYAHEGFAWETLEEYENKEWYAFTDLKTEIGPASFNQIRHLEELFWRSTVTIESRVAMQLLRHQKADVEEFFSSKDESKSWRVDYNTQKFIPLYKDLPEPIRGRPLIKGWVPDEYLNFSFSQFNRPS